MPIFYTDGSSTIGVKSSFCVTDGKGVVIQKVDSDLNPKTNNEEEYRGVIWALENAKDGDIIYTDSLLVVNQINGLYKGKYDARRLQNEI